MAGRMKKNREIELLRAVAILLTLTHTLAICSFPRKRFGRQSIEIPPFGVASTYFFVFRAS